MKNCKYFYPDGEEITGKDDKSARTRFIEFYSKVYRYENHRNWDSEVEMEDLLGRDNDTPLITMEIAYILAWKANRKPIWQKGNDGKYEIHSRGGTMTIRDELIEDIEFKQPNGLGRNIDCESARKFIRFLVGCENRDSEFSQSSIEIASRAEIKFVYALTLLFFVSKGRYPIYDRYAHVGLKSVMDRGNPTDEQCKITESCYRKNMFHGLEHKTENGKKVVSNTSFERAWGEYLGYKSLLMEKDAFGDVYGRSVSDCRNVDRALWAYGHLFYVPYEKKKKEDGSDNE